MSLLILDQELLTHGIQAMIQPLERTALLSFADHLSESVYEDDPWAEALLLYLNEQPDQLHNLLDSTVHQASTTKLKDETVLHLTAHSFTPIRVGRQYISSWLPVYTCSYVTGTWLRRTPTEHMKRMGRRTTPSPYVRWRQRVLNSYDVARELVEFGGIGNLVHAIVGLHYFNDPAKR